MTKITNNKERCLFARLEGDEGVVIAEGISYIPLGHSRRKWYESRVYVTKTELEKILQLFVSEAAPQ
jgi:hypothetical protein